MMSHPLESMIASTSAAKTSLTFVKMTLLIEPSPSSSSVLTASIMERHCGIVACMSLFRVTPSPVGSSVPLRFERPV